MNKPEFQHKAVSFSMVVTDAVMRHGLPTWEKREPITGLRHNHETKWVNHRFPIKGGKTNQEMMWSVVSEKNAFLHVLMKRNA